MNGAISPAGAEVFSIEASRVARNFGGVAGRMTPLKFALGANAMLDRMLAAIDDSKEGTRALRFAIELARNVGADLKVITVVKPLPACFSFAVSAVFADTWRRAQLRKCAAIQVSARQQMTSAGIYPDMELVAGDEVQSIVRCAKQYRADLIVIARRTRAIVTDHLNEEVAERSSCAVLGVP